MSIHLSWNDGEAFAIADSSEFQNSFRLLRWSEKEESKINVEDVMEFLAEEGYFNRNQNKPKKSYNSIRNTHKRKLQEEEIQEKFLKEYEEAMKFIENTSSTIVTLNDGSHFEILPTPNEGQRDVVYIAGSPGNGKTFQSCRFLKRYEQMWPDRKCYIFTADEMDETILVSGLKNTEIISLESLDPSTGKPAFLNKEWDQKDFIFSCVMFDDIDGLMNKEVYSKIRKLMMQCLLMGRHTGTTMVLTNHMLTDYQKTRQWIQHSTWVMFFPQSSIGRNTEYFLRSYVGVTDDEALDTIMKMGRWVAIKTHRPQVALSEYKCILLSALNEKHSEQKRKKRKTTTF